MMVTRICWDCPEAPVRVWKVVSESRAREGHMIRISCPNCNKESRILGWMVGCECEPCKSQVMGAAK